VTDPKTAGLQQISLLRRPVAKKPLRRFTLPFLEQKIQFARRRVAIHLLVESGVFKSAGPLKEAPVFLRRQAVDCGFYLLDPVRA